MHRTSFGQCIRSTTLPPLIRRSTWICIHSRLKLSTTVNARILAPLNRLSDAKSTLQHWSMPVSSGRSSRLAAATLHLGRKFKPSSQYMPCLFLWLTCQRSRQQSMLDKIHVGSPRVLGAFARAKLFFHVLYICLSKLKSANICFKRRFSSSSCFKQRISEILIPPISSSSCRTWLPKYQVWGKLHRHVCLSLPDVEQTQFNLSSENFDFFLAHESCQVNFAGFL